MNITKQEWQKICDSLDGLLGDEDVPEVLPDWLTIWEDDEIAA